MSLSIRFMVPAYLLLVRECPPTKTPAQGTGSARFMVLEPGSIPVGNKNQSRIHRHHAEWWWCRVARRSPASL